MVLLGSNLHHLAFWDGFIGSSEMSIEFITGKPGGGKSYAALRLIERDIVGSKRCVSTNLSLDIERFCEYLHSKYGESFGAAGRVRILTPEETAEFWLYRYRGRDIDPSRRMRVQVKQRKVSLDQVDYTGEVDCGVLFVIDEVHLFFDARKWATTGEDALYYLSQHRKFSDDVILVSQHSQLVEKSFSRLAEFFWVARNMQKWRLPILGGLFAAPEGLMLLQYPDATVKGGALRTQLYRIDKPGLGSCYRTAAGVGFVGAEADTEYKRRGLPWYLFVVGLVLVVWGLAKGVGFATKKTLGSTVPVPNRITNAVPVTNRVESIPESLPAIVERRAKEEFLTIGEEKQVYFVGKARTPKGLYYLLSDGRKIQPADRRLRFVNEDVLILETNVFRRVPSLVAADQRGSKVRLPSRSN